MRRSFVPSSGDYDTRLDVDFGVLGGDGVVAADVVAPAERLGVLRELQPTMPAEWARRMAENADGAACADAVSGYAALGRDGLGRTSAEVRGQGTATATPGPRSSRAPMSGRKVP
ncbi:hypothetical protein [Streptomyces sp. BE133]|uniref:hypothetical protein n=1 Tax=Streptomyces sp. BE133 TaxID=3002523 RepID=UPI002E79D022|nr:hypothetical protein [Streptomyces sp. BE133]MEE1807098.1 hypothetical protein [Streptomyces sp. BE133]